MILAKTTPGVRDDTSTGQAGAFRVSPLLWLWLAGVAAAWFLTLDLRHLLPTDEGRYAEIAREMVASGDWLTIHYNGVKYFEKPPLQMWATAIAYELFGIGEWQARLWTALSGAGGVVVAAFAARRWFGDRVALFSACVLLGAPGWNAAGHVASLDMGVSFAMACALCGILVAQHPAASPEQRRGWMIFAWAAMGAAVMSKGLIGIVLPLAALAVYSVAARDIAVWRRLHPAIGIATFLVVAAPWFVLVSIRNPEFPQFFFIHEHWARFTSTVHDRSAPWWYFLPQLAMGFFPWLFLAPWMVRAAMVPRAGKAFRPAAFLAAWAATIFVFFSLSGSKLPGYIIPIYPALAILAALALDGMGRRAWRWQIDLMLLAMGIGLLVTPFVTRFGHDPETVTAYEAFKPWLAAAFGLAIAGLAAARWLGRDDASHDPASGNLTSRIPASRSPASRSVVAFSTAFFVLITVAFVGHENFGRPHAGIPLLDPIEAVLTPDMPIYSVRMLDHTLPFYLRHTMVMVQSPDELDFGVHQEPDKWLPTIADFERVWKTPRKALAIMSPDTFRRLKADGLVMLPVAKDMRRVVVTNVATQAP